MYPIIYFEISGRCNAVCQWCSTGQSNKRGGKKGKFIDPGDFENALKYIKDNGLADENTVIKLFSWGEPLLHPQLKEIVEILNRENFKFGLSTNSSRPIAFSQAVCLSGLTEVLFSMPGFSQKSYDRIHGFNFEKIKKNISGMLNNFRQCGFTGAAQLIYHIYQFNMDEIEPAIQFAQENQMVFSCGMAYINDWNRYRQYLTSQMEYEDLKRASQDLFLHYIDEKLQEKRLNPGVSCPQFNLLLIDENCNVGTCCILSKNDEDYAIGNLFELSKEQIDHMKRSRKVCRECDRLGIWYLIQSPVIPKQIFTICG